MKKLFLAFFFLLQSFYGYSQDDWQEKDVIAFYSDCFTEKQLLKDLKGVHYSIIGIVCQFIREQNYEYSPVIHSGLRSAFLDNDIKIASHGKYHGSRHKIGMAIDFHLEKDGYSSMTKGEKKRDYYRQIILLEEFLENNLLTLITGVGYYCNQINRFFHLDSRGYKARWARLEQTGTNYVSIDKCKSYLLN